MKTVEDLQDMIIMEQVNYVEMLTGTKSWVRIDKDQNNIFNVLYKYRKLGFDVTRIKALDNDNQYVLQFGINLN